MKGLPIQATENCRFWTCSVVLPFEATLDRERMRSELQRSDEAWNFLELGRANTAAGLQFRCLVVEPPKNWQPTDGASAMPIEAGLQGEAYAWMRGELPGSPPDPCADLVWVLLRGQRLTILVCKEGRALHWLCEDGWSNAEGLAERLLRFRSFVESDPLLQGTNYHWLYTGDEPKEALGLGLAQSVPCNLERGFSHCDWPDPLAHTVERRKHGFRRFWKRVARHVLWAVLLALLVAASRGYHVWRAQKQLAALEQASQSALAADGHLSDMRNLKQHPALQGISVPTTVVTPWFFDRNLELLYERLAPATPMGGMDWIRAEDGGSTLRLEVQAAGFDAIDSLLYKLKQLPDVVQVVASDKRRSGSAGVRFRLEMRYE